MGNGQGIARFLPKPERTMSIKAYKYRIYANKTTTDKLYGVLNLCCEIYNAGLQERHDAYEAILDSGIAELMAKFLSK